MISLSKDNKAANHETWVHIHEVQKYLFLCKEELGRRCLTHDQSKLYPPEVEAFTTYAEMNHIEYGSTEYEGQVWLMRQALAHHYKNNRHHPEHFENGIEGMNLIDVLEMTIDWLASSKRSKNGNIQRSLVHQQKRFDIDPQLLTIIKNTIAFLEAGEFNGESTE